MIRIRVSNESRYRRYRDLLSCVFTMPYSSHCVNCVCFPCIDTPFAFRYSAARHRKNVVGLGSATSKNGCFSRGATSGTELYPFRKSFFSARFDHRTLNSRNISSGAVTIASGAAGRRSSSARKPQVTAMLCIPAALAVSTSTGESPTR